MSADSTVILAWGWGAGCSKREHQPSGQLRCSSQGPIWSNTIRVLVPVGCNDQSHCTAFSPADASCSANGRLGEAQCPATGQMFRDLLSEAEPPIWGQLVSQSRVVTRDDLCSSGCQLILGMQLCSSCTPLPCHWIWGRMLSQGCCWLGGAPGKSLLVLRYSSQESNLEGFSEAVTSAVLGMDATGLKCSDWVLVEGLRMRLLQVITSRRDQITWG